MIHPSQLRIVVTRPKEGGQQAGLSMPSITVKHLPTGCVVTVNDGRSQMECRTLAIEALEYVLLGLRWKKEELEMEIPK